MSLAAALANVDPQQTFVLVLIVVGISLYITQWLPSETVSILIIGALASSGVLHAGEAFSGLSNPATVTVGAMFVISSGLLRSGALEALALKMADYSKGRPKRLLIILFLVVPPASAFLNNTPIVVMFIPVILSICRQFDIRPSKLLIPLSFFSILGGTCTLLGTSTNIIVSDLYRTFTLAARENGVHQIANEFALRPGFQLFDFGYLGLAYLAVGSSFLIVFSQRLLPERASLSALLRPERKADFVTEVSVPPSSPLVGQVVEDAFDGSKVRLLEMMKGEEVLLLGQARREKIESDDSLIVEGTPQEIDAFLGSSGADLSSVIEDDVRVPMRSFEMRLAEAVILPNSKFEGQTVSELRLNRRFGVKVMAVQRHGRHHRYRIRAMRLHGGDVLLIQADAMGLAALGETEGLLVVDSVDRTLLKTRKAPAALGILALVIGFAVFNPFNIPIAVLALLGAGAMLLTRVLRIDEAFRALDSSVLLMLAATIPLGVALERSGLAHEIVDVVVNWSGVEAGEKSNDIIFLSIFYLLTSLLTAILSNTAVAVLLVPIAFGLSERLGINHEALLMAICFGASASFLTPIGYQTNAIVMGPGGYTFKDFLKIGIPMNILMWITASILIPLFWPL